MEYFAYTSPQRLLALDRLLRDSACKAGLFDLQLRGKDRRLY